MNSKAGFKCWYMFKCHISNEFLFFYTISVIRVERIFLRNTYLSMMHIYIYIYGYMCVCVSLYI